MNNFITNKLKYLYLIHDNKINFNLQEEADSTKLIVTYNDRAIVFEIVKDCEDLVSFDFDYNTKRVTFVFKEV